MQTTHSTLGSFPSDKVPYPSLYQNSQNRLFHQGTGETYSLYHFHRFRNSRSKRTIDSRLDIYHHCIAHFRTTIQCNLLRHDSLGIGFWFRHRMFRNTVPIHPNCPILNNFLHYSLLPIPELSLYHYIFINFHCLRSCTSLCP